MKAMKHVIHYSHLVFCAFLSFSFLLFEFFALYQGVPIFFLLHIFLVAMLIAITAYGRKKNWDLRFYYMLLTLFIPMGPVGACVNFFSLCLYQIYLITKTPFIFLLKALYPEPEHDNVDLLYERINTGLENLNVMSTLVPFEDVMAFGTTSQKRDIIEKILRYYRPEFAKTLLQGIHDKDNGIRVLSATAITRLDSQYMGHIEELQKAIDKHPDQMGLLLKFAMSCEAFARSGIIDEDRRVKMLRYAEEAYQLYCESNPENTDALLALGRICYLNGEYDQACDWFEKVVRTSDLVPMETFKWLLSALFEKKDYGYIRKICARIQRDSRTNYEAASILNEQVSFWAGNPYEEMKSESR